MIIKDGNSFKSVELTTSDTVPHYGTKGMINKHEDYSTMKMSDLDDDFLAHHGILGMKWGKKNGPPYPLDSKVSTGKRLKNVNDFKTKHRTKYSNEEYESTHISSQIKKGLFGRQKIEYYATKVNPNDIPHPYKKKISKDEFRRISEEEALKNAPIFERNEIAKQEAYARRAKGRSADEKKYGFKYSDVTSDSNEILDSMKGNIIENNEKFINGITGKEYSKEQNGLIKDFINNPSKLNDMKKAAIEFYVDDLDAQQESFYDSREEYDEYMRDYKRGLKDIKEMKAWNMFTYTHPRNNNLCLRAEISTPNMDNYYLGGHGIAITYDLNNKRIVSKEFGG